MLDADRPERIVARLRAAGCVFAEDEAALLIAAATSPAELDELVTQRCSGVPLEPLLGWAEFGGRRILLEPGVFVPRRRTEFLVELAVETGLADADSAARESAARELVVLDLCCGSGAIGLAVAARLPAVELHAADVDPVAVRCATRNLAPIGGQVHAGDLYRALPADLRGRVSLLLVNAPYVPSDEIALMPSEARDHEPRTALDGGPDGVAIQRRVAAGAREWLAPDGHIFIETSRRQLPVTLAALEANGLRAASRYAADRDATIAIGRPVGTGE